MVHRRSEEEKVYRLFASAVQAESIHQLSGVVPDIPFLNGTDGHNTCRSSYCRVAEVQARGNRNVLLARFLEKRTLEGGSVVHVVHKGSSEKSGLMNQLLIGIVKDRNEWVRSFCCGLKNYYLVEKSGFGGFPSIDV